jgi:GH15 family glucan-1,4-alpha-glucosidase
VRIEDYAMVGDLHTAALVGADGSVDWLCLPRFDSDAAFAALLGDEENGSWRLAPTAADAVARRSYRGDSLVLDTEWSCGEGRIRVTDLMPPRERQPRLVRIVEGLDGDVAVRGTLRMRLGYGRVVPWVTREPGGLRAVAGPDALWLTTAAPLLGADHSTVSDFRVRAGERVAFVLAWAPSTDPAPAVPDPLEDLQRTEEFWSGWSGRLPADLPYRVAVVRSLVTLKGLIYQPTGGIVAAATTSLPEDPGGVRNWDYRFCWLRDAALTLGALLRCGYVDEAAAWRNWLVRAVAGDPADVRVLYGVAGERRLPEVELGWLAGYEGARPVRIGNGAADQVQLDVYGEVLDALHLAREAGLPDDERAWAVQQALLEHLEQHWRDPDQGLWEMRGEPRHFVHSKVMAWVAFDRAAQAVAEQGLPGDADHYRQLRDAVHANVLEHGLDPGGGSFVQSYGSTEVDAALLLLPQVGFLPPDDPRVAGTVERVQSELVVDGLVRRYRTPDGSSADGVSGTEGAFLACSFWLADALALVGRWDEAQHLFERLLALVSDVGLLAEEYDPIAGRQLGNTPQAFSHVGLVNTALNLTGHSPQLGSRRRHRG